jgi:hypothetical protein
MKNKLDEIIKERLENRLEWRNYLGWLLTHRDLHTCARKEFYKDKPFLNLILKLYFLPYNTMKYFTYMCDRHKFEMIETEIRMLKGAKDDENEKID